MSNEYDGHFFDRNGKRMTLKQWCVESNSKHAFQKEATVNGFRILTKWTGVDMPEYEWMVAHQFSLRRWNPEPYKPKVFVTYVWNEDLQIVHSKRYAKIEQAYKAHFELVEEFQSMDFGKYVPLDMDKEQDGEEEHMELRSNSYA
jgi:hypothetical protein